MTSDEDSIRAMNEAIAGGDIRGFVEQMHPDAVWEHNPGSGSPEEGVYEGHEEIGRLLERILEGWDYIRPESTEIRKLEPGVYLVLGNVHCKHPGTENVLVDQYEQRLEVRDGLLAKARMVTGSTVRG